MEWNKSLENCFIFYIGMKEHRQEKTDAKQNNSEKEIVKAIT